MTQRNDAIDGLRGWLSISVCIYHGFLIPQGDSIYPIFFAPLTETASVWRKMLLQVINGDLAVNVFFVMSGAVLFGSLTGLARQRRPAALALDFTIRRVFRIYPAFIVVLLGFTAAYAALQWLFPGLFQLYFTTAQLLANLSLAKIVMYGASWTLQVEMAAIPFILLGFWAWRRTGEAGLVMFLAVALLARESAWLAGGLPNLQQRLFLFILGMLAIGPVGEAASRGLGDRSALAIPPLLILGASLVDYRAGLVSVFQGLLAALAIAALFHGRLPRIGRALGAPVSVFLGHISYAFYVINPVFLEFNRIVILRVFGWAPMGFWPDLALGVSATLCSIPLCVLCYRYVEVPGIRAGRLVFPALRFRAEQWLGIARSAA